MNILPLNQSAMSAAKSRWASIAKPLNSLGALEDMVVRLCGILDTDIPDIHKKCIIVMCADNGVVARGVTQTDSSVTRLVAGNIAAGRASVSLFAKRAQADVFAVDIGMNPGALPPGVHGCAVMRGTNDFTVSPAMTPEIARAAIDCGINWAGKARSMGYRMVATGEMGIGNTTTSTAMIAALLHISPENITGRGAGLSTDGLSRKIAAIKSGLNLHRPTTPFDALCTLGGLDIAGLVGVFLGCAIYRIPAIVDGLISSVAALCAYLMHNYCINFMFASHISSEPAGKLVLSKLGLLPILDCGMHLGEGTGAVMTFPIWDMALDIYTQMPTFSDIALDAYKEQK